MNYTLFNSLTNYLHRRRYDNNTISDILIIPKDSFITEHSLFQKVNMFIETQNLIKILI